MDYMRICVLIVIGFIILRSIYIEWLNRSKNKNKIQEEKEYEYITYESGMTYKYPKGETRGKPYPEILREASHSPVLLEALQDHYSRGVLV